MKVHCIKDHKHGKGDCVLGGGFIIEPNMKENHLPSVFLKGPIQSRFEAIRRYHKEFCSSIGLCGCHEKYSVLFDDLNNNFEELLEWLKKAREFIADGHYHNSSMVEELRIAIEKAGRD